MRLLNLNTVLCVGIGLTLDPQRLAGSGLEVDAMDFSKFDMDVMREIDLTDEFLDRITISQQFLAQHFQDAFIPLFGIERLVHLEHR